MLKQVLVGLNGSEFSAAAMDYAISLAGTRQLSLIGLGIVDVPHLTAPQPTPLGAGAFKAERDEAVVRAAREAIDAVLANFEQQCAAAGIAHRTMKLEGDPSSLLVREAQRVDLLVVGKKHVPLEEWDQVSRTLEHLLRHTPRPVLCVPRADIGGSTVLVAYDGSISAARTLLEFVHSGLARDCQLHVLSLGKEAHEHAELAADFLRGHDYQVQIHVEDDASDPAQQILTFSQQISARMVVAGCYGRSRLVELVFGSTTRTVLRDTQVPLFLYH